MANIQIAGLAFQLGFLIIALFYFLMILWFAQGWHRLHAPQSKGDNLSTSVSILIAARNEDHHISSLLDDLSKQTYPPEKLEIILVDDHSETSLSTLPAIQACRIPNLRVVSLPEGRTGKKTALIEGSGYCNNELLLFTDADCNLDPEWVRSTVDFYESSGGGLIIGLVDQHRDRNLLKNLFRLDFLSLVASGAGAAAVGHPLYCNGANMAIARTLYLKFAGELKTDHLSGDDVFLLHAVKKRKQYPIQVLKSKRPGVKTEGPGTAGQFLRQRIRWASKSSAYRDRDTLLAGSLVILMNLVMVGALTYSLIQPGGWKIGFALWIIKLMADLAILFPALHFFGGKRDLFLLPIAELIYPLYIVGVFAASLFTPIQWKQ